jgi:hypothetical protein
VTVIEAPPSGPDAVPRLELREWQDRYGVTAGITTRGPSGDYTLGLWSGSEPVGAALRRWGEFRAALGPGFGAVVVSRQVHGREVRWHERGATGLVLEEGFDGHATVEPGLLLAVSVADCVPVYLLEPRSRAVALLHAGWRGVAVGILEAGLDLLSTRASVGSENVIMHCGISICGNCYEVGPEVISQVTGRRVENSGRLDLRAELTRRARVRGVGEVTVSPYCAAHDGAQFHSHRASAGYAGRMIAYLGRAAVGA